MEERGIRPHSLEVTTISALMGEIVKGKGNLSQLSVRGNYRAVAAQEMGKIYSRNLPQHRLFVSKYAQKTANGNQNAEFPPPDTPGFEELPQGDSSLISAEVLGKQPGGWAIDVLKLREQTDVARRIGAVLRESSVGSLRETDGQIGPDLTISQELGLPEKQEKKSKEAGVVRAEDSGCLNFRFTTDSLTEGERLFHMILLTCGRGGCEELVCDRGTFGATIASCRKNRDGSDMFMHFIDFMAPVNSICLKCLAK